MIPKIIIYPDGNKWIAESDGVIVARENTYKEAETYGRQAVKNGLVEDVKPPQKDEEK